MHFTKKMISSINSMIEEKELYLITITFEHLELDEIADVYDIVNKAYYYLRSNVNSVFCKNTYGMIKKYLIQEIAENDFILSFNLLSVAKLEYVPQNIKTYVFMSLIKILGISKSEDFTENSSFAVELTKIDKDQFWNILVSQPVIVKEANYEEIKKIMWLKKVVTFSGDFRKLKLKYNRKKRHPSREG